MHMAETVCHFSLPGQGKRPLPYTGMSLGKRVTASDCFTLCTEPPPEKKNMSWGRLKGTCIPGKLSAIPPGRYGYKDGIGVRMTEPV